MRYETKCWGNNDRGVSFKFGQEIVTNFLRQNDFDLVCRAHQVVEDGYEFFAKRQLVTIFSAPNYCGEFDNAGAMMSVNEQLMCHFHVIKPVKKKLKYTYSSRVLLESSGTNPQNIQDKSSSKVDGRVEEKQKGKEGAKQKIQEKQQKQQQAEANKSSKEQKENKKEEAKKQNQEKKHKHKENRNGESKGNTAQTEIHGKEQKHDKKEKGKDEQKQHSKPVQGLTGHQTDDELDKKQCVLS
ncbi:hypothetical protein C0J52_13282 [Blattella germanica]|nr:hypothetical protein C0J52_13282 [Blattella germanica]